MPKLLTVRALTEDERARIVWLAAEGRRVAAIAAAVGCHEQTVRFWLTRFNAAGVAGLHDQPRPGCPATYAPEQIGAVVAAALSDPQALDRSVPGHTTAWRYI